MAMFLWSLLLLIARGTGALFIFSGISKLVTRTNFRQTLNGLPFLPPRTIPLIENLLPWLEVGIGSLLVLGAFTRYVTWGALALLFAFSLVAVSALVRGVAVPCACFGEFSSHPLSWRTVIRNVFFALLLLPLVFMTRLSPWSWDAIRSGTESTWDVALVGSFPIAIALIAVLVAAAQRTLVGISTGFATHHREERLHE